LARVHCPAGEESTCFRTRGTPPPRGVGPVACRAKGVSATYLAAMKRYKGSAVTQMSPVHGHAGTGGDSSYVVVR
jgi:hypothetical protein